MQKHSLRRGIWIRILLLLAFLKCWWLFLNINNELRSKECKSFHLHLRLWCYDFSIYCIIWIKEHITCNAGWIKYIIEHIIFTILMYHVIDYIYVEPFCLSVDIYNHGFKIHTVLTGTAEKSRTKTVRMFQKLHSCLSVDIYIFFRNVSKMKLTIFSFLGILMIWSLMMLCIRLFWHWRRGNNCWPF